MFLKTLLGLCLLLLVCGGWNCNTTLVEELVPPADEASRTADVTVWQSEMARLFKEPGVLHSPIPDDVYSLLWGEWVRRGNDAPRAYYTRYMDADGVPIVGSDRVDERMFNKARGVIRVMLSRLPGVREALSIHTPGVANPHVRFRLILLTPGEKVANVPDLQNVSDDLVSDGYLAVDFAEISTLRHATTTMQIHVVKTPHQIREENGWEPLPPNAQYPAIIDEFAGTEYVGRLGVRTAVHEMAHIIHGVFRARPHLFPGFEARLAAAYETEMELLEAGGPSCYGQVYFAHESMEEYWANGAMDLWFDEWHYPDWSVRDGLTLQPRQRCGDLANLLSEVFSPFHF